MLLLASTIVTAGLSFTCTPTRVWDGDGPIWCAEGPKIRLAGIATREIDETCRSGHPCPKRSGKEARDHLVSLIGSSRGRAREGHVLVAGKKLRCVSRGSGRGERTDAFCATAGGTDLSCAMVRSGYALRWADYDRRAEVCRAQVKPAHR
jgi:endonuclease YncB( thermonuclease family)